MQDKGLSETEFKRRYPHLARELEAGTDEGRNIGAIVDGSRGYEPGVIDFLKRCDTEKSALEIIDYLAKRKEISSEYAELLRTQLRERGLRSFGEKRKDGHYFALFRDPNP